MKAKPAAPTAGSVQAVIEKRRDLRSPLFIVEVKCKRYDKVFIAQAKNISIGGMLMAGDRIPKVGERFPIEFVLPDGKTRIDCTGEVVWTKHHGSEGSGADGVGVRFVDLDDKKMKAIEHWIKRQESPPKK